jgi:hypothetical protein
VALLPPPDETGYLLRFFWSSNHLTWVVQSKDGSSSEYGEALDQSSTAVDTATSVNFSGPPSCVADAGGDALAHVTLT